MDYSTDSQTIPHILVTTNSVAINRHHAPFLPILTPHIFLSHPRLRPFPRFFWFFFQNHEYIIRFLRVLENGDVCPIFVGQICVPTHVQLSKKLFRCHQNRKHVFRSTIHSLNIDPSKPIFISNSFLRNIHLKLISHAISCKDCAKCYFNAITAHIIFKVIVAMYRP